MDPRGNSRELIGNQIHSESFEWSTRSAFSHLEESSRGKDIYPSATLENIQEDDFYLQLPGILSLVKAIPNFYSADRLP